MLRLIVKQRKLLRRRRWIVAHALVTLPWSSSRRAPDSRRNHGNSRRCFGTYRRDPVPVRRRDYFTVNRCASAFPHGMSVGQPLIHMTARSRERRSTCAQNSCASWQTYYRQFLRKTRPFIGSPRLAMSWQRGLKSRRSPVGATASCRSGPAREHPVTARHPPLRRCRPRSSAAGKTIACVPLILPIAATFARSVG